MGSYWVWASIPTLDSLDNEKEMLATCLLLLCLNGWPCVDALKSHRENLLQLPLG